MRMYAVLFSGRGCSQFLFLEILSPHNYSMTLRLWCDVVWDLKLFACLFLFVVGQVRGRFDRLDRIRGQLTWGRDGVTEIFSEAGPAL